MNKPGAADIPAINAGTRAARLRRLLQSPQLEFLMEAHNGISARIAEEAGFAGIWASGLALSAQFGVRDNNEASWTQVVDMLEFMSDVTTVPILLDGDTGYGNFNNTRRRVHRGQAVSQEQQLPRRRAAAARRHRRVLRQDQGRQGQSGQR